MSALDVFEGLADHMSAVSAAAVGVPDLASYDRILVAICGKDSLASLLHLLDLGVPRSKIELHHHSVDGGFDENGEPESTLMDWPCTHGYIQALGDALGLPVFFSWRSAGLEGEMLRENCGSRPIVFFDGTGRQITLDSSRSQPNTRLRFPQVSASLSVRWCSWSAKLAVFDRLLTNDRRFTGARTLVVTGERAEESPNRASYSTFEPHRVDNRQGKQPRHIDHWRPVHGWLEQQVWSIIQRYRVLAHPCYSIGPWNRASCQFCVFTRPDCWATLRLIDPLRFGRIAEYERRFGTTIHRSLTVDQLADRGTPFVADPHWVNLALSRTFTEQIIRDPWVLPAGAYGDSYGPS